MDNKSDNLAITNPELASEWNYERNGDLKPTQVTLGSDKKVWWKCTKGHEYESRIIDRSNNKGCPYCSNHRVLEGYNDLTTTKPELAKEWNYGKNGNLKPTQFTSGSGKKVWWKCDKGHEWQAIISSRSRGSGCPYCSNMKILIGYNDLATTYPELAKEWNYEKNGDLKPTQVVANTNKIVWWKCSKGHEWQASISNRSKGSGCPYCSNYKALEGYNDLATTNPEIAKEWNYERNGDLKPTQFTIGSDKKVWWKCKNGHEWQVRIAGRSNGRGCPFCAGQKVFEGYNDLATTNPELAEEWNYEKNGDLKPTQVTISSGQKVWWKCKNGHEWQAVIASRSRGSGCPYCSNVKLLEGYNDLATTYPELAKEWNYEKNGDLKPTQVMKGCGKKVWWTCSKGHDYQATINHRSNGSGCPYCSNYKVLEGYNDLATLNPELAKEWNFEKNGDLKPKQVTASSSQKVWWKCSKGHEWQTSISHRSKGSGCPHCHRERISKK